MCSDDPEAGHLRDGQVDEHDAARKHLLTERHVRENHQEAGNERRPQNAQLGFQVLTSALPADA